MHHFVHWPGRPPAPSPVLAVYADSWLSQPRLGEHVPALVADLRRLVHGRASVPMGNLVVSHVVEG